MSQLSEIKLSVVFGPFGPETESFFDFLFNGRSLHPAALQGDSDSRVLENHVEQHIQRSGWTLTEVQAYGEYTLAFTASAYDQIPDFLRSLAICEQAFVTTYRLHKAYRFYKALQEQIQTTLDGSEMARLRRIYAYLARRALRNIAAYRALVAQGE